MKTVDDFLPKVTERTFDKEVYSYSSIIPRENLRGFTVMDEEWGEIKLRLDACVTSEKLGSAVVEYPATWFDHFKRDVLPRWLSKRYPPKMITRMFDAKVLYPEYQTPDPFGRPYFIIREWNT